MSREFEVAIIGGGIAGLSAALTIGRLGRSAVLLSDGVPGGELVKINRIDGIPGHEEGIAGYDLCPITQEQAEEQGVEIMDAPASSIIADGDKWRVSTGQGDVVAKGLIVATGTALAKLNIPGFERLKNKGVSECASCDAPLLRGKSAIVAGGGDSAMQEALVLAEHLESVIMLVKSEALSGQKACQDAVANEPKITCRYSCEPLEVLGDDAISHVRMRDKVSGEEATLATDALFAFVGLVPNSEIVKELVDLDPDGRIKVDNAMRSSVVGICAAGNIRQNASHRAAGSMGDAATAAVSLDHYLATGRWGEA